MEILENEYYDFISIMEKEKKIYAVLGGFDKLKIIGLIDP